MWTANLSSGIIILLFGLIIRIFKASWLIAGYNTSSKEEKAKYDEEKLTKFVGNMLITSSAALLMGALLCVFPNTADYAIFVSWILFTLIIIGGVIFMNTGNRFKR